jgi:hypothetical protein
MGNQGVTPFARHPEEDALARFALGEGTAADDAAVGSHLAHCPDCREVIEHTRAAIAAFSGTAVPDPGPDFEARMWQRLSLALPTQARQPSWPSFGGFLVLAATLVAGTMTGYWWVRHPPTTTERPTVQESADTRRRVLLTALDSHLFQTEILLVELLNAPDTASLSYERGVADNLLSSTRLYRATAESLGQGPLESVLDDIQPVLVEIARSSDGGDLTGLALIRERIEAGDLLFKVRAAAQDVRSRQRAPGVPEGAL